MSPLDVLRFFGAAGLLLTGVFVYVMRVTGRAMAAECADDPDLLARVIARAKADG